MLAVGDIFGHFAGASGQLAGAGIRNDSDGLLRRAQRQAELKPWPDGIDFGVE